MVNRFEMVQYMHQGGVKDFLIQQRLCWTLILVPLVNRSIIDGGSSIRSSDKDSNWTNRGSVEVATKTLGFDSIMETDFEDSPVSASALKLGHRVE
jgi:hypothetical protein